MAQNCQQKKDRKNVLTRRGRIRKIRGVGGKIMDIEFDNLGAWDELPECVNYQLCGNETGADDGLCASCREAQQ